MPKIDECYNQPTGQASAGTTTPAGKTDTVSPSKFTRNETSVATEEHDVKALRDKQLDSNFMQSNGFSSKVAECNHPAPRRGFGTK
jgi:hypothetical protein